MIKLFNIA
jgi:hypothetical protein